MWCITLICGCWRILAYWDKSHLIMVCMILLMYCWIEFAVFCWGFLRLYSSVICCCSVTQSCLFVTPWIAALQASLSFTITQSLLKLMSIESMMPSNHLIFCCFPLLPSIFPSIRVFSSELALHIRWPKYWSFSISPSSEYSELISFRMDWFDFFAVQVTLKEFSLAQVENISSLVLGLLYGPALTSIHDYWKNHSFGYMDLCWQSNVSTF